MKVAVVHDWLVTSAGSERVLEQLLLLYPTADLFSLVDFLPEQERQFLSGHKVRVSFIQRLPGARRYHRQYLPLMPLAVEQFDLSGYDLIISNSHAVAKGVLTGPDQLHICFCHSPMRYAWDLQHQYLRQSGLDRGFRSMLTRYLLHRIRIWDLRTANGVDSFVANSRYIARRIWKIYRRESVVIHPPVDTDTFSPGTAREDFYLTASRMVPYKRMDLIVAAFSAMPNRKLVVIGDGPDARKTRAQAGPNVEFLGYQPLPILRDYMQRARAFVFAAEEDFGIVPVEAQACGTPVIAFGKGGTLDSVRGLDQPEPTGVFFPEQTVPALSSAVQEFEAEEHRIHPKTCRSNALRFGSERFRNQLSTYLEGELRRFDEKRASHPRRKAMLLTSEISKVRE